MKTAPFDALAFIQSLVDLSPRQGKNEMKTAAFLKSCLTSHGVPFRTQTFSTKLPVCKATLKADKKSIPCEGTSFVSGNMEGKDVMISSAMPSSYFQEKPNINFNPYCKALSCGNYYFAPAVAVAQKDLSSVLKAKKVSATVKTTWESHTSQNILVGNVTKPTVLCFAHFDSIKTGAVDNASGTATMMQLVLEYPELLEHTLFIFSGNEELSADKPYYWGRGFRQFQKKYPHLFRSAKRIIDIDCVGNGKAVTIQDPGIVERAFPIENVGKYAKKIWIVVADLEHLMEVYHSDLDDGRGIKKTHLHDAVQKTKRLITGI